MEHNSKNTAVNIKDNKDKRVLLGALLDCYRRSKRYARNGPLDLLLMVCKKLSFDVENDRDNIVKERSFRNLQRKHLDQEITQHINQQLTCFSSDCWPLHPGRYSPESSAIVMGQFPILILKW